VRKPDIPSSSASIYAQGLSGKYLGMINKNFENGQILKKYRSDAPRYSTPQFGQQDSSSSYSGRPQKKWIRGPYKTKRQMKLEGKLEDKENVQMSKRH
jgi:hypothetical protein